MGDLRNDENGTLDERRCVHAKRFGRPSVGAEEGGSGRRALHLAAANGHAEVLSLLLDSMPEGAQASPIQRGTSVGASPRDSGDASVTLVVFPQRSSNTGSASRDGVALDLTQVFDG